MACNRYLEAERLWQQPAKTSDLGRPRDRGRCEWSTARACCCARSARSILARPGGGLLFFLFPLFWMLDHLVQAALGSNHSAAALYPVR